MEEKTYNVLGFYKIDVIINPIRPREGGGGGLRGPNDQTHSCQSETPLNYDSQTW